jgi:SAM-dependent methyltransferase
MRVHPTATGFDRAASAYEAGRPGYPLEAVDLVTARLGIGPGRVVLDLGAGTGKLTRELLARGAHVVAVEPMAGMREQLRRVLARSELELLDGTAEELPLPAGAVDAATVAQAFHWFDGHAALAELHRVLRPDGWLAVVCNRRDLRTPVQGAIDELLAPYRGDTPSWSSHDWDASLATTDRFVPDPVGSTCFPWGQDLTVEGLRARVGSVSFVARLDPATREQLLDAVTHLHAEHHDGAAGEDATITLHYVTEVRLLQRRALP